MCKSKILNSLNSVFSFVFIFIFIQVIIGTKANYSYFAFTDTWKIVSILLLLLVVCYFFFKINNKYREKMFYCLCIGWICIQIIYVYTSYAQNGSDAYVVNYYAYWNRIKEIEDFYYCYLAQYQNNIGLTYIISLVYKFLRIFISFTFDQTWIILAIISAICCNLSIIFTVLFSRIYLGRKYDCLALIFACTLIGMSEEGLVFYSDIISLWTIPCFFFLIVLVINEKRIKIQFIEYVLMGGVLGIGGWLKPQVIICFIALMCYLIVSNELLRKKVYIFLTVGIILLFTKNSLSFLSVNWYQKSVSGKIENEKQFMEDNRFPMLHWMNFIIRLGRNIRISF